MTGPERPTAVSSRAADRLRLLRRTAAVCALLPMATLGCRSAPDAAPVAVSQPIPLGLLELTVSKLEAVPVPPPQPVNTLSAQPGDRVVAIFVEWRGLDGLEEPDRFRFLEAFLEGRLTLEDESGNEYRALGTFTGPMYTAGDVRGMLGGVVPREWVVVFHVAEEARTFALLVENPEPPEGAPELARVDLGTLGMR